MKQEEKIAGLPENAFRELKPGGLLTLDEAFGQLSGS